VRARKAQITGPIGLTGLIMFLYGIGILYGRQFFEGMVGVGQKYNLLALVACLASLFVALGLGHIFGIKLGHTLGIYAGSMTSTASLQAALDVLQNKDPSIGYSIAYPFGVIGPILCIYFMTRVVKPKFPAKTQRFAYSPAEIKEAVENVGVKKTNLPFLASLMLAVIAGGSIGLGALYYTIIVSDPGLSFATARVMGGLAFSLGLVIVLVGGAELFTGNNLIVMGLGERKCVNQEDAAQLGRRLFR
jgi:uncharacterized transporter YbjL